MKITELKDKIVLAELDPNASYIMLYNRALVPPDVVKDLQTPGGPYIYIIPTYDIDKSLKFVEIPKKDEQSSSTNKTTSPEELKGHKDGEI